MPTPEIERVKVRTYGIVVASFEETVIWIACLGCGRSGEILESV